MPKTVAEHLAAEAVGMSFAQLPPEVVHQVKRSVIDIVGCGIGGYQSEPSQIVQSLAKELVGPPDSTTFVSGFKTSCLYAALSNGVMVRYLDYIDRGFRSKDARDNLGHHGESIAPILAVGEKQHATGKEVITAVAAAYEFLNRICSSIGGNDGALGRGWTPESMRTGCVLALVAGKLLGLNEAQIANAVGIAGSFNFELNILNSWEEQITMTRNLRFPYPAYGGIHAALLARLGMKGPLNVFEGHNGIAEVVAGGDMDLDALKLPRQGWSIVNTWMKAYAADGNIQGQIEATLELVKKNDIKPDDVTEVRIRTNQHAAGHQGNPIRRRPKTKYSADHSTYYTTAVAILDRAMGPAQYSDERLRDPKVQQLSDKVFVEADPELEGFNAPAAVQIATTSGKHFEMTVLRPKGHPMNPMSDNEVEAKFRSLAGTLMDDRQMSQVISTIWDLDKLDDVGRLLELLVVPGQSAIAGSH